MLRRDPIEVLQEDIVIPEIVQKSADEAFRKIQGENKKFQNYPKKNRNTDCGSISDLEQKSFGGIAGNRKAKIRTGRNPYVHIRKSSQRGQWNGQNIQIE